jgi:hypothetical protein
MNQMKQNKKVFLLLFLLIVNLFIVSALAHAQGPATGLVPCRGTADNPCTFQDLVGVVMKIINLLLGLSWLVAILFVFWGAWKMVTSWGNSEAVESGKKTFSNAIIGFFLIMVAYILLNFVVASLTGGSTLDAMFKFIPGAKP